MRFSTHYLSIIILGFLFTLRAHASEFSDLTCRDSKFDTIEEVKRGIFRFGVEIQCSFPKNEKTQSAEQIKRTLVEAAKSVAKEIITDKEGENTTILETIDVYKEGNDFLRLKNKYIFKSDNKKYTGYTRTSQEILKASGYSKYTERVFAGSGILIKDDQIIIKSKQVFDIRKPGIVPESLFKSEVGKVIEKSTKVLMELDSGLLGAKLIDEDE